MRMAIGSVELRPRSTGEIFALAFQLYRRRFPTFVLITSAVLLPIFGLNALLSAAMVIFITVGGLQLQDPQFMLSGVPDVAIAGLSVAANCAAVFVWLLGILWPWAEGALTFSVIEQVLGRALGVRASYGQTRRYWAALWIANFLAQIGMNLPLVVYLALIGVAGVALAVPMFAVFGADFFASVSPAVAVAVVAICAPSVIGALVVSVVLAINWTFRAPVIVGEGASGVQGLSRSVAIARGNRWLIFWRYVLLFILEFVVTAAPSLALIAIALTGMFALSQGTLSSGINQDAINLPGFVAIVVAITVMSLIGALLFAPFRVVFTTLNYLDLRVRKENLAALLAKAAALQPEATAASAAPPTPTAPSVTQSGANWQDVDLDKLTPAQRVGVLFNRLRAEGESAQTLKAMALALREVGDWGGALDSLTRARNVAPRDPEIAYNLMVLYLERRDMTAARQMMQEYLRLETEPNKLAALRNNPNFKGLLTE